MLASACKWRSETHDRWQSPQLYPKGNHDSPTHPHLSLSSSCSRETCHVQLAFFSRAGDAPLASSSSTMSASSSSRDPAVDDSPSKSSVAGYARGAWLASMGLVSRFWTTLEAPACRSSHIPREPICINHCCSIQLGLTGWHVHHF